MAYFKIRSSQDAGRGRADRLKDLLAAVRYSPAVIGRKSFLGSLKRVLLP